jgi:hypothetical protein
MTLLIAMRKQRNLTEVMLLFVINSAHSQTVSIPLKDLGIKKGDQVYIKKIN